MHPSLVINSIMLFIIMVKLMLNIAPNDKNMLKNSEIIDVSNK